MQKKIKLLASGLDYFRDDYLKKRFCMAKWRRKRKGVRLQKKEKEKV